MNKPFFLLYLLLMSLHTFAQKKIQLQFEHTANGKKIVLNDNTYINTFGEKYIVSKLKYYISNVSFISKGALSVDKTVYLIDASKKLTLITKKDNRKIVAVSFLLGIDSTLNCSGAQSGALDPLNDMFWTWNNGYVMFKLEGKCDSSKADNNRIEHHIGGYKSPYKTMQKITLPIPDNYLKTNSQITVVLNLDKYFLINGATQFGKNPVITSPGLLAKNAAQNFTSMFSLK